MPESVVYDPVSERAFVSNVNGGPMEQDANGSISVITEHGKKVQHDWVTGLHSPKGMDLYNGHLYVADVKELTVVDIEDGTIVAKYFAPESGVLNGISISPTGDVYVSDWPGNKIYTLKENRLDVWYDTSNLESPNGLYVNGDHLYIGSWGLGINPDFTTEKTGKLKRISLKTKKLESFETDEWMNLDGLHPKGSDKWFATDFIKGQLLELSAKGEIIKTHTLKPSAADFFYVEDKDVLLVPYLMGGNVSAYKYN